MSRGAGWVGLDASLGRCFGNVHLEGASKADSGELISPIEQCNALLFSPWEKRKVTRREVGLGLYLGKWSRTWLPCAPTINEWRQWQRLQKRDWDFASFGWFLRYQVSEITHMVKSYWPCPLNNPKATWRLWCVELFSIHSFYWNCTTPVLLILNDSHRSTLHNTYIYIF